MKFFEAVKMDLVIWLMGKQNPHAPSKQTIERLARAKLNGVYWFMDGTTIEIDSSSSDTAIRYLTKKLARETRKVKWIIFKQRFIRRINTFRDAGRYYKLREMMTQNNKENWQQVEQVATVGCYIDWDEFDQYLDSLKVIRG